MACHGVGFYLVAQGRCTKVERSFVGVTGLPASLAIEFPKKTFPYQLSRKPGQPFQCNSKGSKSEAPTTMLEVQSRLPTTFKRLVASKCGNSFRDVAVITEVPMVMPGEGEVLVRIEWAGINGGCETFRVRGEQAFQKNRELTGFPLGAEGAGTVVAVGANVHELEIGQQVACNRISAFSKYGITRASNCTAVAKASPEAAALTLSAATACTALEVLGGVAPGKTVLVTAAAGGAGHFAVQLAKLSGCHVVATCGGQRKADALRSLGIERVIDYKKEDVQEVLTTEYQRGIDVIYEGVGGEMLVTALEALTNNGILISMGYISQYPHSPHSSSAALPIGDGLPSVQDLIWKGQTIHRGSQTIFGGIALKDYNAVLHCKKKVFQLFYEGKLKAWIDDSRKFVGLDSVADAVDYMLTGRNIGKVVAQIQ